MTKSESHKDLAHKYGEQSIIEGWTAEYTMKIINSLMAQYKYELSEEIQSAFAQGIVEAAKRLNKLEGE